MMTSTSETSAEKPPFAALPNRTTLTNSARSCAHVSHERLDVGLDGAGSSAPEPVLDEDEIVIAIVSGSRVISWPMVRDSRPAV